MADQIKNKSLAIHYSEETNLNSSTQKAESKQEKRYKTNIKLKRTEIPITLDKTDSKTKP